MPESTYESAQQAVAEIAALMDRGRSPYARSRLRRALEQFPENTELLCHSAWLDYMDDRNDESMLTVKQILGREPEHQSARFLLFELLLGKKSYSEAEQVIIDLLREYPEHPPYYARYAQLMLKTLFFDKAKALADEGLRLDAYDSGCLRIRALCEFIEAPQGASNESLRRLLVNQPEAINTLILVVIALQDRGQRKEAYKVAQHLVRLQPDNVHLVTLARSLKASSHWSLLPLWPMLKYGWNGSIAMWVILIVISRLVGYFAPRWSGYLLVTTLIYVAYSWIWPPLLRRWLEKN